MAFAEAYLQKAGLRAPLVLEDPHPGLQLIVTIPVYNESGLERCLDSLFMAAPQGEARIEVHLEVLILINAATEAPAAVLEQNQATLSAARSWIAAHPHPYLDFHVALDHSLGKKEAGVGVARKVLMDEAARRFSLLDRPGGVIASLDADALVDPDYFSALLAHFSLPAQHSGNPPQHSSDPARHPGDPAVEGCSIYFEHPLEAHEATGEEIHPPAVYDAIAQYELHLRYYLQAVRSTGYPHAFHTVGSAFAVRAGIYVLEGGMNRRQGGEDFYFIQKVAQRGGWSSCSATRVVPSPRPSDRVPFGTGPVVRKLTTEPGPLQTYHPEPFGMLRRLFEAIDQLFDPSSRSGVWAALAPVLQDFLDTQDFDGALDEIRSNSASLPAFRKRFWRWFNMFRIMKFLHFARECGFPDQDVAQAAQVFLPTGELVEAKETPAPESIRQLLSVYRKLQRE